MPDSVPSSAESLGRTQPSAFLDFVGLEAGFDSLLDAVLGEEALRFLDELEFPLARPLEATLGELQRFTPTIEALYVPDIDSSLDEQAAKTRFWTAFKPVGSWWAELPPY